MISVETHLLSEEPMRLRGEEPATMLDVGSVTGLRHASSVKYDLMASLVSDELIVTGKVWVELVFQCSRCLESVTATVGEDGFAFNMSGPEQSVDLTADVREAIVSNFPLYPVCGKDCKGLCPRCGGNLNKVKCGCKPGGSPGWGALADLRISK